MSRKPFHATITMTFEVDLGPSTSFLSACNRLDNLDELIDSVRALESAADCLRLDADSAVDPIVAQYAGAIVETAKGLLGIMMEEYEFRRSEFKRLAPPPEPVSPREAVRDEPAELLFVSRFPGGDQ